MANEPKTFGGVSDDTSLSLVDPLLKEQKNQVDQMRSTYMSLGSSDASLAKRSMQRIVVMQIYHQIGRIIKFTDLMDRLEDKLYDSIDSNLSSMDSFDPATMVMLLKVQSELQETMIKSQLLIKPYLSMNLDEIAPVPEMEETSFGAAIISQESRNNIRTGAQALLTELRKTENFPVDEDNDDGPTANTARN